MAYTTINKSSSHMNNKIYTGNGSSSHALTGIGFKPDWTWIKSRSDATDHILTDIVRGATVGIKSNTTAGNATDSNQLKSFDTDGFTLGSENDVNGSSRTYTSWNWLANGAGSANTDGTITSTVSANTTAGFSIAKYTGTGANASFGHGLGSTPAVYIIKRLNGAAGTWLTYHQSLGIGYHLGLNNTTAQNANDATFANNTAPDTSKIYLGNWGDLNNNGSDFICYTFAEKQGYSKFGSYTGNNSATNGSFFYTGFKPAMIIIKKTSGTGQWTIFDNKRNPSNAVRAMLVPNGTDVELSQNENNMDFLSNGVKMYNGDGVFNASGSTYIYMAFAEAPLVGTNNVPCTAR